MAVGRPWYKRSGSDLVMATMAMPDSDHKWAYSSIIDMLNDRDRPLPDEPGFICGFTGLTRQKWGRVRRYLIEHGYLVTPEPGLLTNPRFEREREERRAQHDASVEHGRQGGRKSAALRAGQTELDLGDPPARAHGSRARLPSRAHDAPARTDSGDIGTNFQESSKKVASLLGERAPIEKEKPPKSAKSTQPPPQAPCAREEARIEESSHPNPSHVAAPCAPAREAGTGRDGGEAGRLDQPDLKALLDTVLDAAGWHPVGPTAIDRALRYVEDWQRQGIDFERVVIPSIKAVLKESPEPTRTLGRFRARIEHEHARMKHNGTPMVARPPAAPVLEPKGEDPLFRPLRLALLEKLGPVTYPNLLNGVTLQAVEHGDRRPMVVNGPAYILEVVVHGRCSPAILAVAREHGFTDLWKGSG